MGRKSTSASLSEAASFAKSKVSSFLPTPKTPAQFASDVIALVENDKKDFVGTLLSVAGMVLDKKANGEPKTQSVRTFVGNKGTTDLVAWCNLRWEFVAKDAVAVKVDVFALSSGQYAKVFTFTHDFDGDLSFDPRKLDTDETWDAARAALRAFFAGYGATMSYPPKDEITSKWSFVFDIVAQFNGEGYREGCTKYSAAPRKRARELIEDIMTMASKKKQADNDVFYSSLYRYRVRVVSTDVTVSKARSMVRTLEYLKSELDSLKKSKSGYPFVDVSRKSDYSSGDEEYEERTVGGSSTGAGTSSGLGGRYSMGGQA